MAIIYCSFCGQPYDRPKEGGGWIGNKPVCPSCINKFPDTRHS